MNSTEEIYTRHYLVSEMLETVSIIRDFESRKVETKIPLDFDSRIMFTGEGSSRIFPAKNIRHHSHMLGTGPDVFTEGSFQLLNYKLDEFTIIGASNSGKTKEIVHLFFKLGEQGHKALYSVTCNPGTPLEHLSQGTVSLDITPELAVAATKSVVAQALVYECLLKNLLDYKISFRDLSQKFQLALTNEINPKIINALVNAGTIFFSGFNNGVAEELTLKTNEILRKKSGYLPGTYLLHGIEEVIQKNDVIVLVDPVESEYEKIRDVYSRTIGATIVAITNNASPFNNIIIPGASVFEDGYLKLASGWNLLVEAGIKLGVQLDKPVRARKIGNEYIEAN